MSCILHIETSTEVCSVAVSQDGTNIWHEEDYSGPNHNTQLGVYVDEAHYHTLVIYFLDGNAGRRVVDQEQGIQFPLSGLIIQHRIGGQKIDQVQLPDLRHEVGPLHLDLDGRSS